MSSIDDLPTTPQTWARLVAAEGLTGKSIHEEELVSASKFQLHQFLLLRVLWKPRIDISDFKPEVFDLGPWMQRAKDMLKGYKSWSEYHLMFRGEYKEGNFFSARQSQTEAMTVTSDNPDTGLIFSPIAKRTRAQTKQRSEINKTPTKSTGVALERLTLAGYDDEVPLTPDLDFEEGELFDQSPLLTQGSRGPRELWNEIYQKPDDEQIVNMAIINFLQAITGHFTSVSSSWTSHRRPFKARFKNAEYEARVDGYLRGKQSRDVRALIEVKSPLRDHALKPIRIQESAQMVAWLKQDPLMPRDKPFRRFHVSQDRHEIWLIFADYDNKYLQYLEHGLNETKDPAFLTMYEVGPYNTTQETHMAYLGPILLALTLRADSDREKEQKGR